ncbi:MAG TPA: S-adenosylmethionine:tRNA ribosyltransferase-isomerase [Bacteroidales bacterium]|nr:S-adenosylmethionine:tRNA ribosyltransferase-isomerase [Bacteroidales bacterium]
MMEIDLNDYDYHLPDERIAQHPVKERDLSKLLVFDQNKISDDVFRNIENYLPSDSLLVFNNTRVIKARILFQKETGAAIEVFCLEPLMPFEYELAFSSKEPVEWKCIIGNLKKWKNGILSTSFDSGGHQYKLNAEKLQPEGEAWRIRFTWSCREISFGQVIEAIGHIPLPPYINRNDESEDATRYQTIYSKIKGSVAAPTAGLHFTDYVLEKLKEKGIRSAEITLHVGAGTFKPVKSDNVFDHEMHCEHFSVTSETVETLIKNLGKIIPVGTTSVRTLESLYWLGVKVTYDKTIFGPELSLGQWEPYSITTSLSAKESLESLLEMMKRQNLSVIQASTRIMIVPGYKFRMMKGIITNFHQPKSTLLLLISAWIGDRWKDIYRFALDHNFRFLSYGDCSLLLKN